MAERYVWVLQTDDNEILGVYATRKLGEQAAREHVTEADGRIQWIWRDANCSLADDRNGPGEPLSLMHFPIRRDATRTS